MIVGQTGSGKSTLARELGKLLELPVIHIDLIHWEAGWIERSGPEKDWLCAEVHARDSWIFEGGRSSTWQERLQRANVLIWLDVPLSIRAWRIFRRTLRYRGRSRPDLPEGCPERFNWAFTKWIWDSRKSAKHKMQVLFESASPEMGKYHLKNQRQIDELMATLNTMQSRKKQRRPQH